MDNIYNRMYSVFKKDSNGYYTVEKTWGTGIQDHQKPERYYAVSGCYGLRRIKI